MQDIPKEMNQSDCAKNTVHLRGIFPLIPLFLSGNSVSRCIKKFINVLFAGPCNVSCEGSEQFR